MADLTTAISGKLMFLRYRDAPGSSEFKLMCLTDSSEDDSRSEISDDTNCGVLKDTGPAGYKLTGTGVIITGVDANEASYLELATLFDNDTKKYWELSDDADTLFIGGYGKINQLGKQASAGGGATKFTISILYTGTVDRTPQS